MVYSRYNYLVGGIPTSLKNMKVSGKDYSIYYGKNGWNHQPETIVETIHQIGMRSLRIHIFIHFQVSTHHSPEWLDLAFPTKTDHFWNHHHQYQWIGLMKNSQESPNFLMGKSMVSGSDSPLNQYPLTIYFSVVQTP